MIYSTMTVNMSSCHLRLDNLQILPLKLITKEQILHACSCVNHNAQEHDPINKPSPLFCLMLCAILQYNIISFYMDSFLIILLQTWKGDRQFIIISGNH